MTKSFIDQVNIIEQFSDNYSIEEMSIIREELRKDIHQRLKELNNE
ncbi:hypothetical protein [Maribacter ulvicola]|uniref:Uncharacterized protein n=1 Tax=Maribacter ulvicola TaxID=228959 RepID=A0A1N6V8V6_9FLAO|nr:hypothetical protein [Maribacter ulvicola]SIQ74321.1 hypothetical protein SAMN05421797_10338 [Maribacter ulvicola]